MPRNVGHAVFDAPQCRRTRCSMPRNVGHVGPTYGSGAPRAAARTATARRSGLRPRRKLAATPRRHAGSVSAARQDGAVGEAFLAVFPRLVRRRMGLDFTPDDKRRQLEWRGRYAEFNLVYDRGTLFGLKTGGNIDAILMSLPPEAAWA